MVFYKTAKRSGHERKKTKKKPTRLPLNREVEKRDSRGIVRLGSGQEPKKEGK